MIHTDGTPTIANGAGDAPRFRERILSDHERRKLEETAIGLGVEGVDLYGDSELERTVAAWPEGVGSTGAAEIAAARVFDAGVEALNRTRKDDNLVVTVPGHSWFTGQQPPAIEGYVCVFVAHYGNSHTAWTYERA